MVYRREGMNRILSWGECLWVVCLFLYTVWTDQPWPFLSLQLVKTWVESQWYSSCGYNKVFGKGPEQFWASRVSFLPKVSGSDFVISLYEMLAGHGLTKMINANCGVDRCQQFVLQPGSTMNLKMNVAIGVGGMRWLDIALFFSSTQTAAATHNRAGDDHAVTSPQRSGSSYLWRCKTSSLMWRMISWLHRILMTLIPWWKARRGHIYVVLLSDDSQSSGEHANPLQNSAAHKSSSSISWSVFIRFWCFWALELPLCPWLGFYTLLT